MPDPQLFDFEALTQFVGDREHAESLVQLYAQHGPKLLAEVRDAFESGNIHSIREYAHSMKGAVSFIHANDLHAQLAHLETSARNEDMAMVEKLMPDILRNAQALNAATAAFTKHHQRTADSQHDPTCANPFSGSNGQLGRN